MSVKRKKADACRRQQVHKYYGKHPITIVPSRTEKVKKNGVKSPVLQLDKNIKDRTGRDGKTVQETDIYIPKCH